MPEYVRGDGLGNPGFVGDLFDDSLNGANGHAGTIMLGEVVFD